MNVLDIEKKCTGCGACIDSCPFEALRLEHNNHGFYEPCIDKEKCIDCGKCIKVCPAININEKSGKASYFYGWTKDEKVREKSSSGGAFSLLADEILKEGGVVFGAKFGEDHKSVVMASTEECTLDELRRSKYCQAKPSGMYKKMEEALKNGKKVMLTGTPCQIAAARKMFGRCENLVLVDFLCGGISPDTAYSDYITYLEEKYGAEIKNVNFRSKKNGWQNPSVYVEFKNGKKYFSRYQLDYYNFCFYIHYMKNEACTTCPFTSHPDADITIADFWGYKNAGVKCDGKGMSLICTFSENGERMLEEIKDKAEIYPLDEKYAEYGFKEKKYSEKMLKERKEFLDSVAENSFVSTIKSKDFKGGKICFIIKRIKRRFFKK